MWDSEEEVEEEEGETKRAQTLTGVRGEVEGRRGQRTEGRDDGSE